METTLRIGLSLAVVVVLAMAVDAPGQAAKRPARPAKAADGDEQVEDAFLPADRSMLKKLTDAHKLLAENHFGEAIRYLGDILKGPEDFFFQPDKNSPLRQSLKAEAQRQIGRMPPEGRELYELEYGARARQMLDEALATDDVARLAEVSRRFFHTRGGCQATFLLGLHCFDHGQPLAGALVLRRLREAGHTADEFEPALSLTLATCWLRAGRTEKARQSLVDLRRRDPTRRVTVAGREVPLFTDNSKAVQWFSSLIGPQPASAAAEADIMLDDSGGVSSVGGPPLLSPRWRVPLGDPFVESMLEQQQWLLRGREVRAAIPTLNPLVVGDVLLMRTLRNLLAVDFATGKRLWEAPADDAVESIPSVSVANYQQRQIDQAVRGIEERICGDLTYGTLSSDGRRVYSVEDSGPDFDEASSAAFRGWGRHLVRWGMAMIGRHVQESGYWCNRLVAHDVHSGELQWELGGPDATRQADTFFFGPPLPLMGQLYVLAEVKGEIRLLVLEAATGESAWSQPLAAPRQSIFKDPLRRWAGMSPLYADGVLVCPTSTGAIVGFELATRSFLWGYCYREKPSQGHRHSVSRYQHISGGTFSIGQHRVMVTSVESDWIHCLDLIDGELLWKRPRQRDDRYVACMDRDKVVLVGRREVRAVRLADGKPAWDGRVVNLPNGGEPSGRGFLSGDGQYFLPLGSAEVVGIDLAAGKITQVYKSRQGIVPGNLICHRGKIISQGVEGIDCYWQLDAARAEVQRRLAASPDDAEALALRGEILLDAGKRLQAIDSFRRAYELDPRQRTRDLLRDLLLEGLREEFAVYRGRGAEIQRLLDDHSQRAAFLRLMVDGLRREGELASALECCQKLLDLEPDRQPLDQVDKGLLVRRDRWVQSRLAELREEANGETAAKIDQLARRCGEGVLPAFSGAGETPAPQSKQRDADWPLGKVEIAAAPTRNTADRDRSTRVVVEILGSPGPFFRDLSIQFNRSRLAIVAYDGLGRQRWQVSLAEDGQRQNSSYAAAYRPRVTRLLARANGHLLLIALGWQIVAIDVLGSGPNVAPRVLWTQDINDPNVDFADRPLPPRPIVMPWQLRQQLDQFNDRLHVFGPLGSHYVCFRRLRNLVAVDPLSGKTLWVRQDLPLGCVVFGDDRHVFALPPDRDEALVLRAADGELAGTRKVPWVAGRNKDSCLATMGRKLLLWLPEADRRVLSMFDPLAGREIWSGGKFAADAKACVIGEEVVGVMEPGGRFVLMSLPDGRTIADLKLETELSLKEITLFESGGRYFLLTGNSIPRMSVNTTMNTTRGVVKVTKQFTVNNQSFRCLSLCPSKPIHRGRLYAFDREWKLLWPAPVEIRNQWMPAHQPSRLPVLSFACQVSKRRYKNRYRVLCIDKRSGRTVYKANLGKPTGIFQVVGDAEKKTVELTMRPNTVTLTFTDKPLPPPSAADADESSLGSKTARAFWSAILKIIGLSDNDYYWEDYDWEE